MNAFSSQLVKECVGHPRVVTIFHEGTPRAALYLRLGE